MRVRISDGWCSELVRAGMALGLRVKRLAGVLEGSTGRQPFCVRLAHHDSPLPPCQYRKDVVRLLAARADQVTPLRPAITASADQPLCFAAQGSARCKTSTPPLPVRRWQGQHLWHRRQNCSTHFKFLVFAKKAPHRERHPTRLANGPHPPSNSC